VVRKSASRKGVRVRVPPSAPHINSAGRGQDSRFIYVAKVGVEGSNPFARLGFLDPFSFAHEDPRSRLLDFLGFPWILSSESRFINELHGILAEKSFASPFPCATRRSSTRADGRGHGRRGKCLSTNRFILKNNITPQTGPVKKLFARFQSRVAALSPSPRLPGEGQDEGLGREARSNPCSTGLIL